MVTGLICDPLGRSIQDQCSDSLATQKIQQEPSTSFNNEFACDSHNEFASDIKSTSISSVGQGKLENNWLQENPEFKDELKNIHSNESQRSVSEALVDQMKDEPSKEKEETKNDELYQNNSNIDMEMKRADMIIQSLESSMELMCRRTQSKASCIMPQIVKLFDATNSGTAGSNSAADTEITDDSDKIHNREKHGFAEMLSRVKTVTKNFLQRKSGEPITTHLTEAQSKSSIFSRKQQGSIEYDTSDSPLKSSNKTHLELELATEAIDFFAEQKSDSDDSCFEIQCSADTWKNRSNALKCESIAHELDAKSKDYRPVYMADTWRNSVSRIATVAAQKQKRSDKSDSVIKESLREEPAGISVATWLMDH